MTWKREVIYIWFIFATFFALTNSGFDTSEGGYHYQVAEQIVRNHTLGFDHTMEGIFTVAPNGRTYASHEIGNTLFLLPAAVMNLLMEHVLVGHTSPLTIKYLAGFVRSFFPSLFCATTLGFLYAILRKCLHATPVNALSAITAFALCTFFWDGSRSLFDGVLCAMLLSGATFYLFSYKAESRTTDLIFAGIFLGLGLITRLSMALVIVAAMVYLIADREKSIKRLFQEGLIVGAALVPFVSWQLYYNHLRTGNALLSPVQTQQYAENNALDGPIIQGIVGLLFSPGKSIFLYCPIVILSVWFFLFFWRRYRQEAIFTLVLSLSWLLLHAKLRSWFGAWGWGPRHFLTISPILTLPALACWPQWWRRTESRILSGIVLAWGFALSCSSIIGNWLFREELAFNAHTDMIWSLKFSQPVDMLYGAYENYQHIFLGMPFRSVDNISPANQYASNTVNVWLVSAAHLGIPLWSLIIAFVVMMSIIVISIMSWRKAVESRSISREADAMPMLPSRVSIHL